MTLFDKLQAAVTDTVIDYRSDLDHKRALERYENLRHKLTPED